MKTQAEAELEARSSALCEFGKQNLFRIVVIISHPDGRCQSYSNMVEDDRRSLINHIAATQHMAISTDLDSGNS